MENDRPKSFSKTFTQEASDEEIFDSAKINTKTLDKITEKKIVDGIIAFGNVIGGLEAYPYQEDFMRRVIWSLITDDGETIVGEFSRQGGKSSAFQMLVPATTIFLPLLAEKMLELKIDSPILKFKNGLWVGVYGPDYDRAALIGNKINGAYTRQISKEILSTPDIGMRFPDKLSKYLGRLPRNSFVKVKSANKRVSIEGETFHLLITDETQEISEYVIKKSMSPFLAATNGTTVHIGSAYPERCYFYDIRTQLRREDMGKTKTKKRYFAADYRIVQKYNNAYKKYIEREKKKLGEHSIEFRMSYELYWAVEIGMFITEEKLLGSIGKEYGVSPFDMTNMHAVGIDVGKSSDSTVVTIGEYNPDEPILIDENERIYRYEKRIKNWLELSGDDYDTQFYAICSFIDNYKWKALAIDATGVGVGLADRLIAKYETKGKIIVPYVFSTQSKSLGYSLFYRELLAERWSFPNSDGAQRLRKHKKFVDQMISLSKNSKNGNMIVQHVSEDAHDDYGDSWMLLNYAIEGEVIGEEVEETMENIYATGIPSGDNNFLHNH